MDLRGILNDNAPAVVTTPSKPPPPPMMMPSTPVQTNSHPPFRDYSQTHPSPGRHMSMDYSTQPAPQGPYASPPPYASAGPYPSRPAQPPPLQQISANDLRSPSIASGPGPSPYRQTPTSSLSASSVGYPFPPQQASASPVQQHRYPGQGSYHRDSFPQPSLPGGMTGPPAGVSYMQPGTQMPQTPPVVTPGGHGYGPHQRSQSTHSTPTPTSAHSQQAQYGAPFLQGSPVAAHHSLPHMEPHARHSSQPPTPVAAPLSRQAHATMSFGQPPSPYKQRLPTAATYPPHPPSQTSPPQHPQPLPPALPRHSSTTAGYDPVAHETHRRSQSRGDRDQSLSVSPKTRVPSLPGTASRPGTSVSDLDPHRASTQSSRTMPSAMDHDREFERAATPAKRKLEDRELKLEELERREVRPPPFQNTNGRTAQIDTAPPSQSHVDPSPEPLKRKVYAPPPVWAQKLQSHQQLHHQNVTIYRPPQHAAQAVNIKSEGPASRHPSPEERRAIPVPHAAAPAAPGPVLPAEAPGPPWDMAITGVTPQHDMITVIADFFFNKVVRHPSLGEMQSRKVQFEIEAKMGRLIHRQTGQRIQLPVLSECVVDDQAREFNFESNMTADYHRCFNQFLNGVCQETNMPNKDRSKLRMPLVYRHHRSIDKFFELSDRERNQLLPACMAEEFVSRNRRAQVRVSTNQKREGEPGFEVLSKIVKSRVADLNLHFPRSPLDCRISINLEMEWDGSLEELQDMTRNKREPKDPKPDREKDRMTYTTGPYQIDLTQVTQRSQGPGVPRREEKQHEIEIEINPDAVLDHGRRVMEGQSHNFAELVEGLLSNIRVLSRKAAEFTQGR